ncbi:MAG: hypothetical protein IAE79_00205 [Anaerolinea sp.]|nr:hypothetical protein [Anaerolinea sp.]
MSSPGGIAVAFLAVFVADLTLSYPMLAAPCAGDACHYQAIVAAAAAVLAAWGLSVSTYSRYILGISVLPVMLINVIYILVTNVTNVL